MDQLDRHISIIIFADIVGYSSMMQTNEKEAMSKLTHFEEALESQTKKYDGEIVKAYGDGCLMLFSSAINALKCAIGIQKKLRQDPYVPLRIGIHVGEIVRKGHDIFGDGVNIASRIESMGVPNSILISSDIYFQIKNHPEFKTVKLGDFAFKNIERDIALYALSNGGLTVPNISEMQGKGKVSRGSSFSLGKKTRRFLIPLSIILFAAFTYWVYKGTTGTTNQPPLQGLVFASQIEANGQAIDPGTTFSQDVTDLYAVFRSNMSPPGLPINADSIIDGAYYAYLKIPETTSLSEFGWRWYLNGDSILNYEAPVKNKKGVWLQRFNYSGGGVFGEFGSGTYTIVILLDGNPSLSSELIIEPVAETPTQ